MADNTLIQGLLQSLLPPQQPSAAEEGMLMAKLLQGPNPVATYTGYMIPQRNEQMRRSLGTLFGRDTSTPAEKLQQAVATDPSMASTPDGLRKLAELAKASGNAVQAAQLYLAAQELEKKTAAEALTAQDTQSQINLRNAQAAAVPIEAAQREKAAELEARLTNARIQQITSEQLTPEERTMKLETAKVQLAARKAELAALPLEQANRLRQFDLEQQRIEVSKQQLAQTAEALKAEDRKAIYAASDAADTQFNLANKVVNIATKYENERPVPGFFGSITSSVQDFLGQQGDAEAVRKEFTDLINTGVLNSLPKGPASDRDIEIASRGFPSAFTNPDHALSFMRGMAKTAMLAAAQASAKAAYIKENKTPVGFLEKWTEYARSAQFYPDMAAKYGFKVTPSEVKGNDAEVRAANSRGSR